MRAFPSFPPELDFDSEAYAFAMIERIQPFLGVDNPWTYFNSVSEQDHHAWCDYLDNYFVKRERHHMVLALGSKAPLDHWLIDVSRAKQWDEAKYFGGLLETLSFSEAVAWLYGESRGSRVKPTEVRWDAASRTLTVRADDKRGATIAPVSIANVPDVERSRGHGTISGLSKDGSVDDDLRRRLAKWPDAEWVRDVHFEIYPLTRMAGHFPCRQDWLEWAKVLITKAGFVEPTLSNAQGLVCAVFGATDWDRFCGAMNRNQQHGLRPVVVQTFRSDASRETYSIHADYASAVGHWVRAATALSREGPEYFMDFESSAEKLVLTLAHGRRGSEEAHYRDYRHSERRAVMHPIGLGFPKTKALSRVMGLGLDPADPGLEQRLAKLFLPS